LSSFSLDALEKVFRSTKKGVGSKRNAIDDEKPKNEDKIAEELKPKKRVCRSKPKVWPTVRCMSVDARRRQMGVGVKIKDDDEEDEGFKP